MLLRDSPYKGEASWTRVLGKARNAKGKHREDYRAEFIRLVEMAEIISKNKQIARTVTRIP